MNYLTSKQLESMTCEAVWDWVSGASLEEGKPAEEIIERLRQAIQREDDQEHLAAAQAQLSSVEQYNGLAQVIEPRTACMTCEAAIIMASERTVSAAIRGRARLSLEIYCAELHAMTYGQRETSLIAYCNRYKRPKKGEE